MDISAIRNDTPGTRLIKHFNNAGCSLHPKPVVDAVQQFLEEESLIGGYEIAAKREAEIADFYTAAATMLNCKSTNIAFVSSATDGFAKSIILCAI
jgi:cysteine desulfurase/selenocysteine lyase